MVEVDCNKPRRIRRRPTAWIRPLGYLASIRGVPAFSSSVALLHSSSRSTAVSSNRPAFLRCRAADACSCRGGCRSALGCGRGKRGIARGGSWELRSSIGISGESIGEESEDDNGDGVSFFPGEVQMHQRVRSRTAYTRTPRSYVRRHHLGEWRAIPIAVVRWDNTLLQLERQQLKPPLPTFPRCGSLTPKRFRCGCCGL